MRLLGRTSSINVRKVLWTAAEIGLAVEHDPSWGLPVRSTRVEAFLKLNPLGQVPVWIDDNGPLWESNVICRYLASRWDRDDLLPICPFPRALVERWMDWVSSDLNPAWAYAFTARVRRHPDYDNEGEILRSEARWSALMSVLDGHLARNGPYATGETFTLADVPLGLAVHRWRYTPIDRPKLKAVSDYYVRLQSRPAFRSLARPDDA